MIEQESKGIWLRKELWFSICSQHQEYDPDCNLCNTGSWTPVWRHMLSHRVYKLWPWFWRLWVNKVYPRGLRLTDFDDNDEL